MSRRIVPVLALWLLAPWTAECSWGGFALRDYPGVLLFLGPLYGAAAVLIREVVRRSGRGWPSIALLGAAFGVYQAGLVDQSLFNLDYLDDTEFAGLIGDPRETLVPWLGFGVGDAINFVGNHIVLSMCLPIAIVESFVGPERREEPWLGRWGLGVVGVLFVLGSLLIHSDSVKGFTAAPHQIGFAVLTVVVLVVAALWRIRWSRPLPFARERTKKAPRAFWPAVVTFGAAAATGLVSGWGGIALQATVILAAVLLVVGWSRRPGWTQRHVLAAFSGPLVMAAAGAYLVPNYAPATPTEALLADLAITVVTVVLLAGAFWRLSLRSVEAAGWSRGRPVLDR